MYWEPNRTSLSSSSQHSKRKEVHKKTSLSGQRYPTSCAGKSYPASFCFPRNSTSSHWRIPNTRGTCLPQRGSNYLVSLLEQGNPQRAAPFDGHLSRGKPRFDQLEYPRIPHFDHAFFCFGQGAGPTSICVLERKHGTGNFESVYPMIWIDNNGAKRDRIGHLFLVKYHTIPYLTIPYVVMYCQTSPAIIHLGLTKTDFRSMG